MRGRWQRCRPACEIVVCGAALPCPSALPLCPELHCHTSFLPLCQRCDQPLRVQFRRRARGGGAAGAAARKAGGFGARRLPARPAGRQSWQEQDERRRGGGCVGAVEGQAHAVDGASGLHRPARAANRARLSCCPTHRGRLLPGCAGAGQVCRLFGDQHLFAQHSRWVARMAIHTGLGDLSRAWDAGRRHASAYQGAATALDWAASPVPAERMTQCCPAARRPAVAAGAQGAGCAGEVGEAGGRGRNQWVLRDGPREPGHAQSRAWMLPCLPAPGAAFPQGQHSAAASCLAQPIQPDHRCASTWPPADAGPHELGGPWGAAAAARENRARLDPGRHGGWVWWDGMSSGDQGALGYAPQARGSSAA